MNFLQFLKEVDSIAETMSTEEMTACFHELARTIPEDKRDFFIEVMTNAKNGSISMNIGDDAAKEDIRSKVKNNINALMEVNAGKRTLDSEYNEEWDDWYKPEEKEFNFFDPENILPDVEDGIALLHLCIDRGLFKDGCELAELLSALEVTARGDWMDSCGEPMNIETLYIFNLLDGSLENTVRESLFLSYLGNTPDVRAEELYCMMSNYNCFSVSLEDLLQMGSHELPGFTEFLPSWIDFLGRRDDRNAEKLLREALSLTGDNKNQILESARRYADLHPEIYKQIIETDLFSMDNKQKLDIGLEALDRIDPKYAIRGEIALLTASYAKKMNEDSLMETCWLYAFQSDTTVLNYLRLRFHSKYWKNHSGQIRDIYQKIYKQTIRDQQSSGFHRWNSLRENSLTKNEYYAILFFDGQFEEVPGNGMNENDALGWSFTFIKQGLALFLLLLFSGDTMPVGIQRMVQIAMDACDFHKEKYEAGGIEASDQNDQEFFWGLFRNWKKELHLSEREKDQWLSKIERLIAFRTEGIMKANRRNHYIECAAYIAACGEVKESLDSKNKKAEFMADYKSAYSRRSAFHRALREFGM